MKNYDEDGGGGGGREEARWLASGEARGGARRWGESRAAWELPSKEASLWYVALLVAVC